MQGKTLVMCQAGLNTNLQDRYEVSSKTNAKDPIKTKWFKLESYFLQHKVSLIFR
jgi:hypothetical protein